MPKPFERITRPRLRLPRSTVAAALAAALSILLVAPLLPAPLLPAPLSGPLGGPAAVALAADPGIQPRIKGIAPLSRQVYGYLPYWHLDSGTATSLNYDLVSTIAMFGLGILPNGNIDTTWRGYTAYMSADAIDVTNAAHARGVRVVPTFELMDSSTVPKITAFLNSTTAQDTFIHQALDLMAARSADGANLDFEPIPNSIAVSYVAFVSRFAKAMRARFSDATLVVATSAGAGVDLITGLAPVVDQMFVMTYNYHWSGSTVTGAIAPLDNDTRTVKKHIAHFLTLVAPAKLILGVPWYGYDWPVNGVPPVAGAPGTPPPPNATVQADPSNHGGVWSVTYASARTWLADHPDVVRHEDTSRGSGYFSYWDAGYNSWRQVYFEDEQSAAAKYDFAIASGLAGVGIWTLENDHGFAAMRAVLRDKFYAPVHAGTVTATHGSVTLRYGLVRVYTTRSVRNNGTVPEVGTLSWRIVNPLGRVVKSGSQKLTIYPGRTWTYRGSTTLGRASALRAGMYRLYVKFTVPSGTWVAPTVGFRQPY